VLAVERSPVVHALLADGLRRAAAAMPGIAQRITLIRADAREVLSRLEPAARGGCALVAGVHGQPGAGPAKVSLSGFGRPDVVLLDPMFPPGRKTAERKRMRVLRALVGHDMDAGELLGRALVAAARRVVVKRPVRAEPLGGRAPTVSHAGKALRYDVYAVAATS
jgi:16S rRNA (guanine1516-N2)-methyltransferase